MTRIGQRIRKLRKLRKLSQEELGKALGMTGANISRIETGALGIDADSIPIVAKVLGVTPAALFDESEIKKIDPGVELIAQRAATIAVEKVHEIIRQEIWAALEDRQESPAPERSYPHPRGGKSVKQTASPYEPTYADLAGLDAADVYRNLSPEEREIFRNLVRKAESEKAR